MINRFSRVSLIKLKNQTSVKPKLIKFDTYFRSNYGQLSTNEIAITNYIDRLLLLIIRPENWTVVYGTPKAILGKMAHGILQSLSSSIFNCAGFCGESLVFNSHLIFTRRKFPGTLNLSLN
jgi:hypothetical protein